MTPENAKIKLAKMDNIANGDLKFELKIRNDEMAIAAVYSPTSHKLNSNVAVETPLAYRMGI